MTYRLLSSKINVIFPLLFILIKGFASRWTEDHHDGLQKLGSSLEFNLHRMKFIQLLLAGGALEAINYGREHFHSFGEKNYPGNSD